MPMFPMLVAATLLTLTSPTEDDRRADGPFTQRGYYITFMRMPTYDLADWKRIVDGIHNDGGNTLMLWVAGAFRSKKYPVTWKYNAEHENIRHDFVGELIDHAHSKGIKVLLGFTPFGYDGVNQYPLEHPELKAIGKDGKPVAPFGIGCWGYNLCPSKPESQRFMLEYLREMNARYSNADGLMIESSDYAICHCEDCGEHFFEKEFAFVRRISEEVWVKKPEATVVVYPHYFSGADVPGFGVKAAKLPFDPRWTLMFTPHSAHPEPSLIERAKGSLWSDDSPARKGPQEIRANAQHARGAKMTGYVPSLEAFTFVATVAEEGQEWLKGRRQVPLGFGWLDPGEPPYDALLMRVNRIAYREFSRNPDLAFDRYKEILGEEVFGAFATPRAVDDLLELQTVFAAERTWCQPSPLTCPERVRAMQAAGTMTPPKRGEYRAALDRIHAVEARYRESKSDGERELRRIARWVLDRWSVEDRKLLEDDR
ncbi:Hypothetical glycosyl hydrolase 6 [Singulisphaera sp. GP187]|uniref:hypothetical protein n=1 Tax=Singulisphaera sp. GP187 TaxID=1882752 RepID=UPI000927CF58|nr:hypothetical protein [Singulisphaera sp. GP187]SIO00569.1 Hypothetical glycosyl hydrolase 6 [Singulisphaera sp. GP187]